MRPFIILTALMCCVSVCAQTDSTSTFREVVVTGTRATEQLNQLPATVSVVEREALTHDGRTSVLPTLVNHVPGLFVTQRGVMGYGVSTGSAGGITVRGMGSGSGQVMVMIDGRPQYSGIYGHTIADSYQTLLAERVEVVRGPSSVLYGANAMGGVINIVTRQMQRDGVHTEVGVSGGSYATLQAEAENQVRHSRFSSTAAVQYSRSDNHRDNMDFEQATAFVKLGYDISHHWQAHADIDLTHWNASNPGPVTQPVEDNDQRITRGASMVSIDNKYARTIGSVSAYCNWGAHKINDGYAIDGGKPQTDFFRSRDALAGIAAWQSMKLWRGSNMTVGLDYQYIFGHAWYTDMKTDTVVTAGKRGMQSTDQRMHELAAYADYRQRLGQHWTLNVGLRYDHHSVAGGELVPQAGVAYRPTSHGELKATFGKGFRNPSVREMYLYGTRNDELRPERLLNYELAWHHTVGGGRLSYGANLFYMKGSDIIMTVGGKNMNSGEVENWGAEMEASWRVNGNWQLSTNHSMTHMEHHQAYMPEYKGNVSASYTCGRWDVSADLQQLNGLFTVQSNGYASADGHKENVTLLGATLTCRLDGGVSLWLRGDNLLAQKYEVVQGYPMPRTTAMAGFRVKL